MSELNYKRIVDVDYTNTLQDGASVFVNNGGSLKQIAVDDAFATKGELEECVAVNAKAVEELSEEMEQLKENGGAGVAVDATLTESGKASDAKVTGDLLGVVPAASRNLNITAYVNKTRDGVTFTRNEDNSVSLSGTATKATWALLASEGKSSLFYLEPGTYTFSDNYREATGVHGYVCLYRSPTDSATFKQFSAGGDDPITFTIDEPLYGYAQIQVAEGRTVDGITLKLQLEKGRNATEYVSPYAEGTRSKRLDDLEESVKAPFSVPTYYFANSYLYDRVAAVKAKMQECMGHGDAFIFITDVHWSLNAGNSPALINYIADKVNITKLISGGDTGNAGGAVDFADTIRKAFPGRVYHVFGNHEYFYPADGSLLAYNMSMYNDDVHTGDPDRNYYYFDNNRAHIRYIVLDSYAPGTADSTAAKPGYEEAQIAWLEDTALDVPAGWGIIVFTHHMYYMNLTTMALTSPPTGGQAALDALDAYNANESSKGEVICVVQGHTHHDRITHTAGGIPVIITACDKYKPWVEGDVNHEPWLSTRVEGTITEQAFDIVVLDNQEQKLYFFRIGGDAFDGVDNDPGEPVNLRTVSY